jgi:CubicO group peptidase (beta-lactamase class C family)
MRRRSFLAAAGACLAAAAAPRANRAATSPSQERFDALAEEVRAQLQAPGMVFGVVTADGTSFGRAHGVKSLGGSEPVTTSTLFHMASVTKPFVATAIAQLAERGRLRIGQRLVEVLPELKLADARLSQVTIEQVLTHTAGMPDVEDYHWDRPETDEAALRRYVASLADRQLLFAPGTSFAYSNIGFEILARVIEVLDGVPFETAVRNTILRPAGMNSSTLYYPEADRARLAAPHVAEKDTPVRRSDVFPYNRRHAGSSTLLSSVDDMLRWIRINLGEGMLEGTRIMTPQTARDLRTPRPVRMPESSTLPTGAQPALSWFVLPHKGRQIIAHGGVDLGFVSLCAWCPQQSTGVVAMANCVSQQEAGPLLRFALRVLDQQ